MAWRSGRIERGQHHYLFAIREILDNQRVRNSPVDAKPLRATLQIRDRQIRVGADEQVEASRIGHPRIGPTGTDLDAPRGKRSASPINQRRGRPGHREGTVIRRSIGPLRADDVNHTVKRERGVDIESAGELDQMLVSRNLLIG